MDKDWQIPPFEVFEFSPKKTKYCIGIPVINEGEKIKKQLQQMKSYSKMADIIIFDGGSTDGSTQKSFLKKQNVRALIISPKGQAVQLRVGLSWAMQQRYEGVITIDGNGKDGVDAIPKFLEALEEGFDYIQGSRFIKGGYHKNTPFYRIFFGRFVISPLLSLTAGYWYTDTPNAFRAYSQRYLLHPKVKPFRDVFVRYELLFYLVTRARQLSLKTREIPVTRKYPKGKTPTKIVGWMKLVDMLNIVKVALGFYNP